MKLTPAEEATVHAALHLFRKNKRAGLLAETELALASDVGNVTPLEDDQIDALIDKVTHCDIELGEAA